jgi:cytidylate kinase
MRNKISITGDLGSGKSAVGKILTEVLSIPVISTGLIQREIAARLQMTTLELNHHADTHPEIDEEIDSTFRNLQHNPNPYLLDSRLAWFFIPASFKVYLHVEPRTAAMRVMNDTTRKREQYLSLDAAVQDLIARKKSENHRFLKTYNADCTNMQNFNLVIFTDNVSPEVVAQKIVSEFEKYKQSESTTIHSIWVAPAQILNRPLSQESSKEDMPERIIAVKKDENGFLACAEEDAEYAAKTKAELVAITII